MLCSTVLLLPRGYADCHEEPFAIDTVCRDASRSDGISPVYFHPRAACVPPDPCRATAAHPHLLSTWADLPSDAFPDVYTGTPRRRSTPSSHPGSGYGPSDVDDCQDQVS